MCIIFVSVSVRGQWLYCTDPARWTRVQETDPADWQPNQPTSLHLPTVLSRLPVLTDGAATPRVNTRNDHTRLPPSDVWQATRPLYRYHI